VGIGASSLAPSAAARHLRQLHAGVALPDRDRIGQPFILNAVTSRRCLRRGTRWRRGFGTLGIYIGILAAWS
jgi:hypothetical protein